MNCLLLLDKPAEAETNVARRVGLKVVHPACFQGCDCLSQFARASAHLAQSSNYFGLLHSVDFT